MFDDFDFDWGGASDAASNYDYEGMDNLASSLSGADGFDYSVFNNDSLGDFIGGLSQTDSSLGGVSKDGVGLSGSAAPTQSTEGGVKTVGTAGTAASESKGSGGKGLASQFSSLLNNKNGELDLGKVLKMSAGLASVISGITKPVRNAQSSEQLLAGLRGPNNNFTPQQQQWSSGYFNTPTNFSRERQSASSMPSPIVASRGYADGGDVEPGYQGPLSLVEGPGTGQEDKIEARLSPGEYVWDADTVSMVGDGDNSAGAKILDEWRMNLRKHKRAAPADEIPPETNDLNSYMPRGAQ